MPQDRSDKIKVFEVQDRTTVILPIAEVIRHPEEVLLRQEITVPRLVIDPTVLLADLVVGLPVPVVQAEDNKKKNTQYEKENVISLARAMPKFYRHSPGNTRCFTVQS